MRLSRDVLTQRILALLLIALVGWLLVVPLVRLIISSPNTAFIQFLNGLAYSLLVFLIATGFTLIFGMMNFINLAHGSFYMLAAYLAFSIVGRTGDNFFLALIAAPLAIALLGVVLELAYLRPLYKRGHLDQVLLTFGFAYVFSDIVRTVWGSDIRSLPYAPELAGAIEIFGRPYPK